MISLELKKADGIVIIEPSGVLEETDFTRLSKEIDAYINEKGRINGVIIHTKKFPGWKNFGAFRNHMKFIKGHHKKVKRVAAVTDSKIMLIVLRIANFFISAEIKHFNYADMDAAKKWILAQK